MKIEIIDMHFQGQAVGRKENGEIVFVPFGAPGDVYENETLIQPSSLRVIPKCKYFTQCGGCDFQHLPYELQWQTKKNGWHQALKRNAIVHPPLQEFPALAHEQWNYRSRVQFRSVNNKWHMLEKRSHALVEIDRCEIAHEKINASLFNQFPDGLYEFSVRDEQVEILPYDDRVFIQVHAAMNNKLKQYVYDALKDKVEDEIYDFYSGSGNLSQRFEVKTHKVDRSLGHDVLLYLKKLKTFKDQVGIVNPPRSGLGSERQLIINLLKKNRFKHIAFINCRVEQFAKDLKFFLNSGFELEKVALFDFFPQTHHVESVAILKCSLLF